MKDSSGSVPLPIARTNGWLMKRCQTGATSGRSSIHSTKLPLALGQQAVQKTYRRLTQHLRRERQRIGRVKVVEGPVSTAQAGGSLDGGLDISARGLDGLRDRHALG